MIKELPELIQDLPSYGLVKGCTKLGFLNPLDQAWVRVPWGGINAVTVLCPCAISDHDFFQDPQDDCLVVELEPFSLLNNKTGKRLYSILIGQCMCGRIYWAKDETEN